MKQRFIELLRETKRPGMDNLIDYLAQTDFFTAPASSKYHGAKDGGLLEHSLEVDKNLETVCDSFGLKIETASRHITALLHDVCKINFYKKVIKSQKDGYLPNGKINWIDVEGYEIEDQFPLGHGEKSVIILQRYIWLFDEEIMAIRWHMGGFDELAKGYVGGLQLAAAMQKYPLITALHAADMIANNINHV
ncbi:HD domain-containing protein [Sporomusa sphaeroides DSM 2875]|uniref:HD domain-containing protein n=1 Tax=Sporomusa sphaeroides TaxID=47679 RepID=UPI00202DF8B2|nr:HD domain-containing protein [Sporomusa sphaeroides]MCM0758076.1 HD domain-containing protein [Sporomusa sphaeroides DSM 2875]